MAELAHCYDLQYDVDHYLTELGLHKELLGSVVVGTLVRCAHLGPCLSSGADGGVIVAIDTFGAPFSQLYLYWQ